MINLDQVLQARLERLKNSGKYRDLRRIEARAYNDYQLNFSSNDYLGLAQNLALKNLSASSKRAKNTLSENSPAYKSIDLSQQENQCQHASTGSRLTTGTHREHLELEKILADWKHTEAAVIFSSGYMANLGALSVLASPRDLYLVDEGAHSCMWDGIRLSGARKLIYQHQNYQDLTSKLIKNYDKYDSIFIVTESVFSMYGSKCKLDILEKLTYDYPKLIIYLDEAHATGIYGASGAGRSTELSSKENFIIMGTLSKALASEGGYICGSKILIEYLKNTARTFIYSTASSPQICQQSINHINFVKQASQLRDQLKNNIKYFKEQLQAYKISFTNEDSAIFMLPAPDSKQALALEKYFKEQQILVTTILPPTVKQASLRICLSAQHSIAEIDLFCKIFLSFNS